MSSLAVHYRTRTAAAARLTPVAVMRSAIVSSHPPQPSLNWGRAWQLHLQGANLLGKGKLKHNKQTFKVWQPPRAARSNRPNTPSDGAKTQWVPYHQANGYQAGIHSSRGLQPVHPQNYHQKYQTPNQTYLNTDLPEARCLASPPHQYHQTGGIVERHERRWQHT